MKSIAHLVGGYETTSMKKKILLAISIVLLLIAIVVCSVVETRKSGKVTVASAKTIEKLQADLVDINSINLTSEADSADVTGNDSADVTGNDSADVTGNDSAAEENQANQVDWERFANLRLDLQFDGVSLPYDAASRTYYLPVDMEDEVWEQGGFTGVFYKADELVCQTNGQNSKILWTEDYHDADKKLAVANGQSFDLYATTNDYYGMYHVVFTGLPMISFTGSGYMADDGTQIFLMSVYNTDHASDWVTTTYTQAGLRGNTSLTYEKKSLRLRLKNLKHGSGLANDANASGVQGSDANGDSDASASGVQASDANGDSDANASGVQGSDANGDSDASDHVYFVKNNVNLLGLREDDDWILNSLYGDPSRIRDQLAIDLWNEVGASNNPYGKNFGTQSQMVEVIIADGYQGIYDLMVPIDAKQLGIEATSTQLAAANSTTVERIYKKKYSAPFVSADYVGELPDANSPDARGGFYLKGDTILQNEEEWKPLYDLSQILESASGAKNADEDDAKTIAGDAKTIADDAETIADAAKTIADNAEPLADSNILLGEKSGVDVGALTSLVDQQSLIDNWLFYQAIAGFDNENKNYYYVVKNKNSKPYGYFIPWDMNISFGEVYADNVYFTEEDGTTINEVVEWEPGQSLVTAGDANVTASVKATWKSWRQTTFSNEAMLGRVNALEHQVKDSGAFAREDARWPDGNQDADFTALEGYMLDRLEFVDVLVDNLQ